LKAGRTQATIHLFTWQGTPPWIAALVRRMRLIPVARRVAFYVDYARNRLSNRTLEKSMPTFTFPPQLLWITQPTTSYRIYLTGEEAARRFYNLAVEHSTNPVETVYEWGCGTASVIRHMPHIDPAIRAYGSDYDQRLIAWCEANVRGVTFTANGLEPPLPYADDAFDFVYSRSVYTHLPVHLQVDWLNEQLRVVRPGGLLLFTVLGDAYKHRLTAIERTEYEKAGVVEHGTVAAGTAWFTTFNSPEYMEDTMLRDLEIVFKETLPEEALGKTQDKWMVRKTN
jgi:SAM-dependent methyltransferase